MTIEARAIAQYIGLLPCMWPVYVQSPESNIVPQAFQECRAKRNP